MTSSSPVLVRRRGLAAAGCVALLLPVVAAVPAAAQTEGSTTTTTVARTAATQAAALRLTVNLPMENRIVLDIDPVVGTVEAVTGSDPKAQALATLLTGSIGGEAQSFPGAAAMLPEPKEDSGPSSALSEGINDSPLGAFLQVGAVTATASVSEAPSSESTAQIASLGLGLPQELNDALQQVLEPLLAAVRTLLDEAAPLDEATTGVCEGLEPVTVPVGGGAGELPVLGETLEEVVNGTLSPEQGVLCNLRAFLIDLQTELAADLADLTGPGGLFSTGLLSATQVITTEGQTTTARAEARVADLTLLGDVNPFGDVTALTTASAAALNATGSNTSVETVAVEAFAEPLLTLETDLDQVTGDVAGIELDGLNELLAQIETVLEGLAGVGVQAGPLDDDDAALGACPETLDGQLTGTFEDPGTCAAAAARGYGLAVTAPAELAEPLGITGPLVALQIAPSAAVVRGSTTTTTAAAPETRQLPRTGAAAPAAAAGLALLLGAALVRRRRAHAEG